jgi:pimeloyl-ACP methyl ester carboxylesterase
MAPHEVDALGRAAGDAADRLGTTPAQTMHAAIADRVFGFLGPYGLPARVLHDGLSTAVYAGVRRAVPVGARAAAAVARLHGADPELVSRSKRGSQTQAIVNGLIGHELALDDDPLAIQLGLWQDGEPVPPTCDALQDFLPDATPSLVVFVHGLFETERSWTLGNDEPYSGLLREQAGWTPLHVRYNTGLPIRENGRRLARLLDEVAANYPVGLERIALVGHSMGGMVVRVAGAEGGAWRDRLTHVACLGTPHKGAPLEQVVHRAAGLLNRLPETAAFGGILEQRSAGIRDLRRGIDAGPLLDDVHHLFVAATLTTDPRHPVALLVGDLLVLSDSASGPADCEIRTEDVVHLSSLNHFHLLNHGSVYRHLRDFLARPRVERGQLLSGTPGCP